MKFNFKKIASVLTGAVMLSSTVALAAAANFPAPFVQGGAGDYAVVYGSGTTTTDGVVAADINNWLTQRVTTTVAPVAPVNASLTEGDTVQIQKSNDKFNLGDQLDDFSVLDDDDDSLPKVLETAYYYDEGNNEYEYEQQIVLGAQTLGWNQNNDFNSEKPWVGFEFSNGLIMNYTLTFKDKVPDWDQDSGVENTVLKMMGKDFFISAATTTDEVQKITLLDTANSVRINEGETQTLTVGDKSYDITLLSVNDGGADDTVNLAVNNVEITSELSVGETAKVRGEDVYVGVKAATYKSKETAVSTAVITLGTGQLVVESGQEVELNGDALSELDEFDPYVLTGYIYNDSSGLKTINFEWSVDDDVFIAPGSSLTMPALDTVKLSMGNWVTPTPEVTTFDDSSDSLQVTTEVEDGSLDFGIFYGNETEILGLGGDDDDVLVTSASDVVVLNGSTNDFFVATWIQDDEAESYAFRLQSIGSENQTLLVNLADGGADVTIDGIGEEETVGDNLIFTLTNASRAEDWAKVTVTSDSGAGTVFLDRIATKDGFLMMLPVLGTDGNLNEVEAGVSASVGLNFTEENAETENVGEGGSFVVNFGPSDDGAEVKSVTGDVFEQALEDNSDVSGIYVDSDLASYMEFDDVDNGAATLEIQYHPTESYAQVYVSEAKVSFEGGGGGGSAGTVLVTDSQVSSVSGKNLLVVGGSCINTVAAKLLGSDVPMCEAAWMTATNNVGAGSFLIKTFDNPYDAGTKIATLVAGYNAADTEAGVNALKLQDVETTAGKAYVGKPGQTLTLVT